MLPFVSRVKNGSFFLVRNVVLFLVFPVNIMESFHVVKLLTAKLASLCVKALSFVRREVNYYVVCYSGFFLISDCYGWAFPYGSLYLGG